MSAGPAAHEERRQTYERYATLPIDPYLRATLELGLSYERAAVEFWQGRPTGDDRA